MQVVSAQFYRGEFYGTGDFFYSSQDIIRPIISAAIGIMAPFLEYAVGDFSTSQFFFTKVMLLILLFVIIATVLKKVPRFDEMSPTIVNIVALIVSILSVRFISENSLINGILLPYGALGITLATILPFLIFFYFVHSSNMPSGVRKLAWGFFTIVFFVLWNSRFDSLDPLGNRIYGWTLIFVVLVFVFDKSIHRYFRDMESMRYLSVANDKVAAQLQQEYETIARIDTPVANRRKRQIRKELRRLGSEV